MPADPAPLTTSFAVLMSRPVRSSALMSPAAVMIAVPCWSSKDGNVEKLFQPLLDDEAVGRLDVLKVDAPEAGAEIAHAIDEGVRVAGVDLKVDRVHVREPLEEHGLAFHHGLEASAPRSPRPRIAVPFEMTATRFPREV